MLLSDSSIVVTIEGHTDTQGTSASNQTLSDNRALAVFDYLTGIDLTSPHSIAASRLTQVGFGEALLANDTGDRLDDGVAGTAEQDNRRVDLKIDRLVSTGNVNVFRDQLGGGAGLDGIDAYRRFAARPVETKNSLLEFLIGARRAGQKVVGYGAPAKGNTLLNYCGVGKELLPFTVDRNTHKQGLLLPGTRIPIRGPEAILEEKPDYVLILPWNLRDEVASQMSCIRAWGGRFVVPIPTVQVF